MLERIGIGIERLGGEFADSRTRKSERSNDRIKIGAARPSPRQGRVSVALGEVFGRLVFREFLDRVMDERDLIVLQIAADDLPIAAAFLLSGRRRRADQF
jgi:hypothetical protein